MGDFIEKASDILGMPIETVNKAVSFLAKLVAPTLEELSLIPYDYVKAFRYKRNIDILCRTQEYCLEKNIKIKKIELKNILPILEYSSLEEDEDMFQIWTNLLISSIDDRNDNFFINSYINMLKDLGSLEIKILDILYADRGFPLKTEEIKNKLNIDSLDINTIKIAILNLERFNLIGNVSDIFWISILEDTIKEIAELSNNYEEEYSYFRGNNKLRNKDFSNLNLDYGPSMYLLTAVGIDFVKKCKRE